MTEPWEFPIDEGPPCRCGCSMLRHRPRQANGTPRGPERQDCLYGGAHPEIECRRFVAAELDLGL